MSFIHLNGQGEEMNSQIITVEDATYAFVKRNPEKIPGLPGLEP